MRMQYKLGAVVAAFALGFAPAVAIADHPASGKHGSQAGPRATSPANAKAFGKLCSTERKGHVAGQNGTPFSQCIAAMKKAASGQANSPGQACKGMSKRHVAGTNGTPFSQCVVAAAHVLGNQGGTGTSTSTPAPTATG